MKNASKIPASLVPQITAMKGIFYPITASVIFGPNFFNENELFILSCPAMLVPFLSKDCLQNNE